MTTSIGESFAAALAAKDFGRIRAALRADVDFRGLTPRRFWEAHTPAEVEDVLVKWFEPSDDITALLAVETGEVVDAHRVSYRLAITNPDGDFQVEQQVYFTVVDDAISWMRVLCSGYRAVPAP